MCMSCVNRITENDIDVRHTSDYKSRTRAISSRLESVMVARKLRTHVSIGDSPIPSSLRPKHLTKQEFGKRVYELMVKKGWSQSDLARASENYVKRKPSASALSRDNVSTYVRGASLPQPDKLETLAAVLDTTPIELLPNYIESAIDEDHPAFEMKVSSSAPGVAWLRVNRLVRTTTATEIAQLLEKDDAASNDRGGSRN